MMGKKFLPLQADLPDRGKEKGLSRWRGLLNNLEVKMGGRRMEKGGITSWLWTLPKDRKERTRD